MSLASPHPGTTRTARYLVGVSGGLDSTVLLHQLVKQTGYENLLVAHLNHGIREETPEDAAFVEKLAADLGVDFIAGKVEVPSLASELGLSLEHAAREARHAFFAQVAEAEKAKGVFLAHHADDQAETILLQILRGSVGALGMAEEQKIDDLVLYRPLLRSSRSELEAYAREHDLKWRDDPSNADPAHTRNRIRHELLPLADEILGREVRTPLTRSAEIRRAEGRLMTQWTELALPDVLREGAQPGLEVKALDPLPLAIQRRLIRRWLERENIPGLSTEIIERVRSLLPSAGMQSAKTNLPGDRHARRREGLLFLE